MDRELRNRALKAGQPPGTPTYTGRKGPEEEVKLLKIIYSQHDFHELRGNTLESIEYKNKDEGGVVTWINVEGLQDVALITELANEYNLHPLTIEDILNVEQRPKVENFDNYLFITLKTYLPRNNKGKFSTAQISFVLGRNFLLSFQEHENHLFTAIHERLRGAPNQRMREQKGDYLAYRLIDCIIDYYFVVLESVGDEIERIEELIIANPKPENTRTIYGLKRQLMQMRKFIWPTREAISHLLQLEDEWISSVTRVYLRDLYDHIMQAIDTIETFRDMIASMLDIYLSSITNRMNEVMKTLTIIATIFIPITFIASFPLCQDSCRLYS